MNFHSLSLEIADDKAYHLYFEIIRLAGDNINSPIETYLRSLESVIGVSYHTVSSKLDLLQGKDFITIEKPLRSGLRSDREGLKRKLKISIVESTYLRYFPIEKPLRSVLRSIREVTKAPVTES